MHFSVPKRSDRAYQGSSRPFCTTPTLGTASTYRKHLSRSPFLRHGELTDTRARASMSSRTSYDRYGNTYNVTAIINADATLNEERYKAYSPLFLSTTFAMSYGLSFASITSTLTHTFFYFRKQIWVQSRRSMSEQPDIHARLMSRYRQVPEWWYAVILGERICGQACRTF